MKQTCQQVAIVFNEKSKKQCLLDTPCSVRVNDKDEYNTKLFTPESSIYQSLYRKNSLSSHRCHFIKKYFFPNQTPPCICSNFFLTKPLHAYFQCVYVVLAKYQIAPSKAVVGVDRPMKAQSMHIQKPY